MKRSLLGVSAWVLVCATVPAFVTGCGDASAEREAQGGSVSVALTGVGSTGVLYRLRNGVFKISGSSSATASTEDDVSATAILLELKAGGYLATLSKGWLLEQAQPDGSFKTVKAVLTSTNPQPFTIIDQQTTNVLFQFNAGDDVVQLGNGRAAIGIAVNDCGQNCNPDTDLDMDGWPASIDCNDNDPSVSPSMPEFCFNGVDDNCDGQVDEFCNPDKDSDMDGWPASIDCNDNDPSVSPSMPEVCFNGADDNCDGQVDEFCNGCSPEVCDGVDNDCDAIVDEGCNNCMPGDPNCIQGCLINSQVGCPAGLSCYLDDTFSVTACLPPGDVPPGSPCSFQAECAAPAVCAQLNGPQPECVQACDPKMMPNTCPGGLQCVQTSVTLPSEVLGVCMN